MTSPLDPDLVPPSATPPGAPGPLRRESPDDVLVARATCPLPGRWA